MTPVQMNRVLSTVFNKRHQRSNTDMGSMLSINTSDFLSSISLSQVSNYARTKHKCQPSEATESKKTLAIPGLSIKVEKKTTRRATR